MDELIVLFERGFISILEILKTSQISEFRRFQLEKRITEIVGILQVLSDEASDFIPKYFTKIYKKDIEVLNSWMEKYIPDYSPIAFGGIHLETIRLISEETMQLVGTGLRFTAESSRRILRESIKETMLKANLEGITLQEAKKILNKKIEQIGLNCLIDRGGKRWELPRYSEMVLRTQQKRIHREVVRNGAIDAGYDLVIVQSAPDCCEICDRWNGKILSLRSEAPDFADGTLEQAEWDGLFHPNCRCVITPYNVEFQKAMEHYDELLKDFEENENAT